MKKIITTACFTIVILMIMINFCCCKNCDSNGGRKERNAAHAVSSYNNEPASFYNGRFEIVDVGHSHQLELVKDCLQKSGSIVAPMRAYEITDKKTGKKHLLLRAHHTLIQLDLGD